jgi:N-hydroxyarylamine O-acetyltransferase
MKLADYLQRIHYKGTLDLTPETLIALQRAHLFAIPYENLDIHRSGTLSLDLPTIFDKLVTQRRGGWCYEMNSLLAWALRELGFDVTLLSSDVVNEMTGDGSGGDHLVLMVKLDRPYLVDVGFGNGLLDPIPLEPGTYTQRFLTYHLLNEGDRWFFQNHPYGGPGFVFTLQPRTIEHFAARCTYLQTSPESGFVRTTVCHRFTPNGIVTLRGANLRRVTEAGVSDEIVDNPATYEQVLNNLFGLSLSGVTLLWEKVWERHRLWLKETT